MQKLTKTSDLYNEIPTYLVPLFQSCTYPWEILPKIKSFIEDLIKTPPAGYTEIQKGVLVSDGVSIAKTAVIEAPCIIGEGTEIRPGAYIRGSVIIGQGCVIGNSTELKNCILLDKTQAPHYNYIGDSILGAHSHMGAGSICSNLKADGKCVVIHADTEMQTCLRKVGAFLGDGADVGCSCVLNPGTVIGKRTSVYPLNALRGVYPENCIVKSPQEVIKRR
jgi:NDP-sugar pyrophosphorylase family protein